MNSPKFNSNNSPPNADEDYIFTDEYTNPPFYDWNKAENENGLLFISFSHNGFEKFVKEKFLTEMIQMRKFYLMRDYVDFRFIIHKSKSFKLFECDFIFLQCKEIERRIDLGLTFELEDLYCNLVVRYEILFDKLCQFATSIKNIIEAQLIKQFKESAEIVDSFESCSSLAKINYYRNQYKEGSFNFENFGEKEKRTSFENFCQNKHCNCVII